MDKFHKIKSEIYILNVLCEALKSGYYSEKEWITTLIDELSGSPNSFEKFIENLKKYILDSTYVKKELSRILQKPVSHVSEALKSLLSQRSSYDIWEYVRIICEEICHVNYPFVDFHEIPCEFRLGVLCKIVKAIMKEVDPSIVLNNLFCPENRDAIHAIVKRHNCAQMFEFVYNNITNELWEASRVSTALEMLIHYDLLYFILTYIDRYGNALKKFMYVYGLIKEKFSIDTLNRFIDAISKEVNKKVQQLKRGIGGEETAEEFKSTLNLINNAARTNDEYLTLKTIAILNIMNDVKPHIRHDYRVNLMNILSNLFSLIKRTKNARLKTLTRKVLDYVAITGDTDFLYNYSNFVLHSREINKVIKVLSEIL